MGNRFRPRRCIILTGAPSSALEMRAQGSCGVHIFDGSRPTHLRTYPQRQRSIYCGDSTKGNTTCAARTRCSSLHSFDGMRPNHPLLLSVDVDSLARVRPQPLFATFGMQPNASSSRCGDRSRTPHLQLIRPYARARWAHGAERARCGVAAAVAGGGGGAAADRRARTHCPRALISCQQLAVASCVVRRRIAGFVRRKCRRVVAPRHSAAVD